ncbi:MAG: hypothetical protein ACI3YK_01975 [Eubacteriales bacterium]
MEYRLQNDRLCLNFTDVGGKLLSVGNPAGEHFLWSGDPAYWDDRAPILFPFCGRCRDGCYRWQGKQYSMPIHGFLPHTPMRVTEQIRDSITFTLESDEQTFAVYPFEFTLELCYRLSDNRIGVTATVRAGKTPLPFSLGAHPGFVLDGFGDYRLTFASPCEPISLEITEAGLLGKGRTPCPTDGNHTLTLSPDRLGTCGLFLQDVTREAVLWRQGGRHKIQLFFEDFATLGIWRPDEAPFVCLEPWNGLPAPDGTETDLSDKPGVLRLAAGESRRMGFEIGIL